MKVNELVETVKKNKNKSIKSIINTKSYLPYTAKVDLVQSIIKKCGGINHFLKQVKNRYGKEFVYEI